MNKKITSEFAIGIILFLVFVIGVIFWLQNKNETQSRQIAVSQLENETAAQIDKVNIVDEKLADDESKIFDSKLVNLSFVMPKGSNYVERNVSDGTDIKYSGMNVNFKDNNNIAIEFGAITKDYADDVLMFTQDIIYGDLSSANSFGINYFINNFSKVKEIHPGMYHITGFSNIECGPYVSSFLIVRPPKNSNIEYIDFNLGILDFQGSDYSEDCSPRDEAIRKKISDIMNGKNDEVNQKLESAVNIAKTFVSK